MKRKVLKSSLIALLTATISVTSIIPHVLKVTANDTDNKEKIRVAPENMVNVMVIDENINFVDNISVALKDDKGSTVASWTTGNDGVYYDSGIIFSEDAYFDEPIETFKDLIAPYSVLKIEDIDSGEFLNLNEPVRFNNGEDRSFKMYYKKDYPTELTVPAYHYAVNVDSAWSSRNERIVMHDMENILSISQNAGLLQQYEAVDPYGSGDKEGVPVILGLNYNIQNPEALLWYNVTTTYGQGRREDSEYCKMHIRLSDYCDAFNDDGTMNISLDDENGNHRDIKADFAHDSINNTSNSGVISVLYITSGSVVNYPIPDSEGYVDIYVKKAQNPSIDINAVIYWSDDFSDVTDDANLYYPHSIDKGIKKQDYRVDVYDIETYNFESVYFSHQGTTLINIPEGNYTIELSNVPDCYMEPDIHHFTIKESQDIRNIILSLETNEPHMHTADESKWFNDNTNHWHNCSTCDEDVKLDSEVHNFTWVTDKEATATEDGLKHEECTVCGYKKDAVEIPAFKPTEPDTQKPTPEQPTKKTEPDTEEPTPEQSTKKPEPDTEKPTLEQPTQKTDTDTDKTALVPTTKQEQPTQKPTSQSTPVTGDNVSSVLFVLIIASIVLFGGVVIIANKKKSSEN